MIKNKDVEEYKAVKQYQKDEREKAKRLRAEKDAIIEENWRLIREAKQEKEIRYQAFLQLEDVRKDNFKVKDAKRAQNEKENWNEMREFDTAEKEEVQQRLREVHKEYLMNWKVDSTKRAVVVNANEQKNLFREKSLQEKAAAKQRQLQASLERGATMGATSPKAGQPAMEVTMLPGSPKLGGGNASVGRTKSLSPRRSPKGKATATGNAATSKAKAKAAPAPLDKKGEKEQAARVHAAEVLRIRDKKLEDDKKKAAVHHARLSRELTDEAEQKVRMEQRVKRDDTFAMLEESRREASVEREQMRNEACTQKVRMLPTGVDLPMHLLF